MPPHLHPRSRTTSSLFATTLLASFAVVAIPHLLPCPRSSSNARRLDHPASSAARSTAPPSGSAPAGAGTTAAAMAAAGEGITAKRDDSTGEMVYVDAGGRMVQLRSRRLRRRLEEGAAAEESGRAGIQGDVNYEQNKDRTVQRRLLGEAKDVASAHPNASRLVNFPVDAASAGDDARRRRQRRECPIPKPRGVLGRLLGFDDGKNEK